MKCKDTKDKTIYLLSIVVLAQFLMNITIVGYTSFKIAELEDTVEFSKELSVDSYNSNIYAQNYNVELQRDIWDLQRYLNHTMGYQPYYPYP